MYVFVVTAGYPSVYGSLGPAFYPRLIAIALFVFCVIQLVQINVFKRFVKKPGTPGETQAKKETLAALGSLGLCSRCVGDSSCW